jgi:hypothetical protein
MPALLDIDRTNFVSDRTDPKTVRHHLADHRMLSVEALAVLADRLPAANVEHNVAKGIGVVVPRGAALTLDASPGDVARGIDHNGCWMVLKHIEVDPEYNRLLNAALDEVAQLLPGGASAMHHRQGFVFLSAPGSVTPAHCDFEHNFLLQIRGLKTMHLGRFADANAEQRELERALGPGGHRNMEYAPEWTDQYDLEPGDGLYVPVAKPHWVQNGPTVSVSLSITWRAPDGLRNERAHRFNDRLRRLGLSPRRPGEKVAVDRSKALVQQAYDKASSKAGALRSSGSAA